MNNPIPAATHEFSAETVSMAEIRPLAVRLLNETRQITTHVGGRGDVAAELHICGREGGFEQTLHEYGYGPEIECSCPSFEPGFGCKHVIELQTELAHQK